MGQEDERVVAFSKGELSREQRPNQLTFSWLTPVSPKRTWVSRLLLRVMHIYPQDTMLFLEAKTVTRGS